MIIECNHIEVSRLL